MKGGFMTAIDELLEKFKYIESQGYIKSESRNKNYLGILFEKLLGSTGGEFSIPDFRDIEIKVIRKYEYAEFDMFNSSPDGKYITPTQWLSENYGYPDKDYRKIKVLKGDVYGNKLTNIGVYYKYKLYINYNESRIYLQIYDSNSLINQDIYWDFDSLQERLERKLNKIAIIGFNKKYIDDSYFYHYNNIKIYKLKSFELFLKCIENGIIYVTFKTGVNKSGKNVGKFRDHGTSFRISKSNMKFLFDEIV